MTIIGKIQKTEQKILLSAVNLVKLLYVLITVSFGNARQSNYQNVNLLILTVNFSLQFAFPGKSRKTFQVVTFKLPNIEFIFCLKDELKAKTE